MRISPSRVIEQAYFVPLLLLCIFVSWLWQHWQLHHVLEPAAEVALSQHEPTQPIPLELDLDTKKISLGEKLFHEPQLSGDNTISCASCHDLSMGGTQRQRYSLGIRNQPETINTPTVFNSGLQFRLLWDGRIRTLEEQIDDPVQSEREMDSTWSEVVGKLSQTPEYVAAFKALYGEISPNAIKEAIATYERSLYTPNSRFDRFLRGDHSALTPQEQSGYHYFKTYGCVSCHQGVLLGGNMFQSFGVIGDYFQDRGNLTKADLGRFNVTGRPEDRSVFKVPTLRNIARTAPYFHDGSVSTLDEAVRVMAKYQLGRPISQEHVDLIVKFLTTLTGEYQGKPL